jgi:hypothetical protein
MQIELKLELQLLHLYRDAQREEAEAAVLAASDMLVGQDVLVKH